MTICVNLPKVSLKPHTRPTKLEPVWVRLLRLHVESAPPGLPVKPWSRQSWGQLCAFSVLTPAAALRGRPGTASALLWIPDNVPAGPRRPGRRGRAKDTCRERQGLGHLEEQQPPVAESTLVLTTNELGLGLVSTTLPPSGWVTLGQSQICCHYQGTMQLNTKGTVPRASHQPRLSLFGTTAVPASNQSSIAPSQPSLWLLDQELLGRICWAWPIF